MTSDAELHVILILSTTESKADRAYLVDFSDLI